MTPKTYTCQAPGCGKAYTPTKSQVWSGRLPRYCSAACRTQYGRWSYRANAGTLKRDFGTVR